MFTEQLTILHEQRDRAYRLWKEAANEVEQLKRLLEAARREIDALAYLVTKHELAAKIARADLQVAKDEIRKLDSFLNPKPEAS